MLSGTIFVTGDEDVIRSAPLNRVKIISLDEDGILEGTNFIGGTCLLPPMEAKIAEADGNEQLYDSVYSNHLLLPFQQEFITALIAFLYKSGNLILYLPEIGYCNTTMKLVEHLYRLYGIHPGIIGDQNPANANCYYDDRCIPIWLNMIFCARVISAKEYLLKLPNNATIINNKVIMLLIEELQPYGNSINEKIKEILRYHKLLHRNPNCRLAIHSADGGMI